HSHRLHRLFPLRRRPLRPPIRRSHPNHANLSPHPHRPSRRHPRLVRHRGQIIRRRRIRLPNPRRPKRHPHASRRHHSHPTLAPLPKTHPTPQKILLRNPPQQTKVGRSLIAVLLFCFLSLFFFFPSLLCGLCVSAPLCIKSFSFFLSFFLLSVPCKLAATRRPHETPVSFSLLHLSLIRLSSRQTIRRHSHSPRSRL